MPNTIKKSLGDSVLPMIIVSVVFLVPELLGWKDGHVEAHVATKEATQKFHDSLDTKMENYQISISTLINDVASLKELVKE